MNERVLKQDVIDTVNAETELYINNLRPLLDKGSLLLALESIQPAKQWVPLSERPPKEGEEVLCQCVAGIRMVLKYTNNGWYQDVNHTYMRGFVLAWQQLPEPYKENEE